MKTGLAGNVVWGRIVNFTGLAAFQGTDALAGSTEEIAFLAVSLASEDAGYVTGQCVTANGSKYFR